MEYLSAEALANTSHNAGKILCCECGQLIDPNPSNMCVACLRKTVDITEGIPKEVVLYFCKGCERYLQPPNQWVSCALESRELLTLCLKKLRGLNKVRLIDAGFVWTEPHSKRIKVKLTVQKEVLGNTILQQMFVVDFVVNHQMCNDCHRLEAKDFWRAVVQVRQRSEHKRTFYYLEQLILRYKAHSNCVNIKAVNGGIDFFFAKKDDARKLVDFFHSVVPCRYQASQQLISHDDHSNTYNYKYTFSVEIVPVCKDELVCLSPTLSRSLGNINPLCICRQVTNTIHLIDPNTLQMAEVNSQMYWRHPFTALFSPRQLTEYVVMDVDIIMADDRWTFAGQGPLSEKHVLADVWVVRSSELGVTDNQIHCRSHLGHLLKPGNTVMGYDLANANINNTEFEKLKKDHVPDVVLVKKVFGDKASRNARRRWKLKRMQVDDLASETSSANRDYMDFLDDLEENPSYRKNVNIYVDHDKMAVDADDMDDETPKITLQEMLDDLKLDDSEQITV